MKSRLLIIVGIVTTGVITSFLFFPNEQQNTCEQMGGIWCAEHCMITQETFDSNKLTCDPGPVLENETCYSNGIKLILESVIESEPKNLLCLGGRGMIVNEDCERIGKYDVSTGLPIVENKEQCDMLDGDWNEQQNTCDSKYGGK